MSTLSGESPVKSKINHGDYIMLHKAELKAAIIDNQTFSVFSFILDKIGWLFLGIVFNSFFNNVYDIFWEKNKITLLLGIILVSLGYYFNMQKERKIKEILKSKIE